VRRAGRLRSLSPLFESEIGLAHFGTNIWPESDKSDFG
jgi:hypothetical protein